MSKFHVNLKGEPGKCRVVSGRCPFGSPEEHHNSKEDARAAFEKTHANDVLPEAVKKTSRRERKKQTASFQEAFKNYDPNEYEGLRFSDVVFDQEFSENQNRVAVKKRYPGLSRSDIEDAVQIRVKKDFDTWKRKARTEPAKPFETNVPMRLIPIGTEIVGRDSSGNAEVIATVSGLEPRHDVADYLGVVTPTSESLENSYHEANAGLDVGAIPESSSVDLSAVWERENSWAEKLQRNREKYAANTKA